MAFKKENLGVIGQNGQNSTFMYTTEDADTVVEAADYFLDAYKGLRVGDFIFANLDTDGTRETKIYFVATSAAGGVTIDFPTLS
jgi:hypothetical protein